MTAELEQALKSLASIAADLVRRFGAEGEARARAAFEEALRSVAPGVEAVEALAKPVERARYSEIIGESPAILRVLALIDRVAASGIPVLIQGESGTGKELIARAIHFNSPRKNQAFVTENCAAIPETLLESELFGHKRGAFTGADRERKGLFEVADKGTLFLDEIGDMSLNMQKKLLRALQDGEIRAVGGSKSIRVDVRVLSASNRMLRDLVKKGAFREDLFYRLNGVTLELPPLRERAEDVPELARFFVERIAREMGREPPRIGDAALAALCDHRWPGNIRELENEMRRCLALLGPATVIERDHLSEELRSPRRA